jgi:hypothetical protein
MASGAVATGIPNDTAKKRKIPPSASEIFTDPVVPATDETTYNGTRDKVAAKNVYTAQSSKVRSHRIYCVICVRLLTRCVRDLASMNWNLMSLC